MAFLRVLLTTPERFRLPNYIREPYYSKTRHVVYWTFDCLLPSAEFFDFRTSDYRTFENWPAWISVLSISNYFRFPYFSLAEVIWFSHFQKRVAPISDISQSLYLLIAERLDYFTFDIRTKAVCVRFRLPSWCEGGKYELSEKKLSSL